MKNHEICFKTSFPYFGLMILTCCCLLNIWPFFPSRSSKELWIISLKDHHKHVSLLDISWSILLHLSNWKPLRYLQITRSAHIASHDMSHQALLGKDKTEILSKLNLILCCNVVSKCHSHSVSRLQAHFYSPPPYTVESSNKFFCGQKIINADVLKFYLIMFLRSWHKPSSPHPALISGRRFFSDS